MTSRTRPRIALLVAPETSPSVLYGLSDVLSTVGPLWSDMTGDGQTESLIDVPVVAADARPFRCYGNVLVEPHASLETVGDLDAVIVCDMYTRVDDPPRVRYSAECEWLRHVAAKGTLVSSVCSGSLLLAESGLLDGRSCAGHWAYVDMFRSAYPRVRFVSEAILDLSSEPDGIITAGGVTSWQELALHLISRFCGPEHAARTAKLYLLGSHADGQLPFTAMTRQGTAVDDAVIAACLAWISMNYAVPTPVTAMVERSGLKPRTFARRFQAATGRRAIDHVHALRVERARHLLETGRPVVDDVGYDVGYEDPAFFRRLFRRTTGLTPAAYRRKYAPIVGTA